MQITKYLFFGNNPSQSPIPIHEHFHSNLQATLLEMEQHPELYPDYMPCVEGLSDKQQQLTPTQCRYALEVILGAAYLENHKLSVASISNEAVRNRKITELTGLVAEPGLFPGSKESHILNTLTSRIAEVYTAYQMAKEQDQTLLFFQEAFVGPPCFNGRFITLETFMQNILCKQPSVTFDYQLPIDPMAILLEEILHKCKAEQKLPEHSVPTIKSVTEYIQREPDLMKEWQTHLGTPKFEAYFRRACEFFRGVESI